MKRSISKLTDKGNSQARHQSIVLTLSLDMITREVSVKL